MIRKTNGNVTSILLLFFSIGQGKEKATEKETRKPLSVMLKGGNCQAPQTERL